MCGIVGAVSFLPGSAVDQDRILRMRDALAHRGPDGAGLWTEGNVGLGHRRLAIVDIPAGQQPMANEDESTWLVFNGEIYNHARLRARLAGRGHVYRTRSDTESILHLYDEDGIDGLASLEGMFAFALWDRRRRRLVMGRDRLGIKPLYVACTTRELLFASEVKALLAGGVAPRLNTAVVPEYLANRYVAGTATLLEGVTRLAPGHLLTWGVERGIETKAYWRLPSTFGTGRLSRVDAAKAVRTELTAAVERHLMSDVPIGVFLSGGLDSAALAAIAAPMTRGRLQTFAVGFRESEANELPFARLAARAIGADHHDVELGAREFFDRVPTLVWHQDDPLAFSSSVALNVVSRLASRSVKVVLTGEGADELFLGYNRYRVTAWNTRLGRPYWRLPGAVRRGIRRQVGGLPRAVRRYVGRTFLAHDAAAHALYFDNFSVFTADQRAALIPGAEPADPHAFAAGCYEANRGAALDRMSAADLQTYLVELLMKQDRMSMAASIESRVPYLDDRLVALALSLPAELKLHGWQTKAVLRAAVADCVPRTILTRRKMGFPVPLSRWLRGSHAWVVGEFVTGPRAMARQLFDRRALAALAAEHEAGIADHAERLWLLINLEVWHRIFCDGESPAEVMPAERAA